MSTTDSQAWPVSASSSTMTYLFNFRQSRGVGAFGSLPGGGLANLSIVFPGGRTDLTTVSALHDACIRHLLNSNGFVAWWNPPVGTLEQNLRTALSGADLNTGVTNLSAYLFFDGQFSSVTVG